MTLHIALVLGLFLAGPAWADCEGKTSLMEMEGQLGIAEQQFYDQEGDFEATAAQAMQLLPCLQHLVTPSKAVRIHLMMGATHATKDAPRARLAFMAAKALDPKLHLPDWLSFDTPAGRIFNQAPTPAQVERVAAPVPMSGGLRFDGSESGDRPTSVPTIFQRIDSTGRAVEAAYLWPEEALPTYPSGKKKKKKKVEELINNVKKR